MHTMWKGSIRFGLVYIPIKLYAATEEKDVKLRMIHEKCSTPIRYSRVCPTCKIEVPNEEIIKAYEYEPGQFVPINKKELDTLKGETSKSVDIIDFVKLSDIDPIYFNKSYFIGPNENGEKAYGLLTEALQTSEKIGLAKLNMHGKEHLSVIRSYSQTAEKNNAEKLSGLLLETIYYPDEVRKMAAVPGIGNLGGTIEKELKVAIQLIDQLTTTFEPEKYEDHYRAQLQQLITSKITGNEVKQPVAARKPDHAVDLLSALQASIEEAAPRRKKAAAKPRKTAGRRKKAGL